MKKLNVAKIEKIAVSDARTFAAEHPEEIRRAVSDPCGADDALISALGYSGVASLFKTTPANFSNACKIYSDAFRNELIARAAVNS